MKSVYLATQKTILAGTLSSLPFPLQASDTERVRECEASLIAFGHPQRLTGAPRSLAKEPGRGTDRYFIAQVNGLMNSQSEICHFKNKEEGKLKGDRERQGKKGSGEGDTVLKCPIFWPSPVFQWNKENSASFFSSFLPPLLSFSLPSSYLSLRFSLQKFS